MQHTLRAATAADHDFVRQLLLMTPKAYVEQTWGWTDEIQQLVEADFERWFNAPASGQIVEVDGRAIGYIKVADHEDGVLLDMVLLEPSYQNRGLGTALIAPIVSEAHARGQAVVLQVFKGQPFETALSAVGLRRDRRAAESLPHARISAGGLTPSRRCAA